MSYNISLLVTRTSWGESVIVAYLYDIIPVWCICIEIYACVGYLDEIYAALSDFVQESMSGLWCMMMQW